MNLERVVGGTRKLNKDERRASQGYVDIKTKTIEQLDELLMRQNKLLKNSSFLEKLPDKGQKIQLFKVQLETERKKKLSEYEATCQLFSNLSLSDTNIEEIEWNQEKSSTCQGQANGFKKNSEEDSDPLQIVATHSGTANGKLVENNFSAGDSNSKAVSNIKKIFYIDKFCEKYGKTEKCKDRFKPNQLRNNDRTKFVTSAINVKKILGDKWEVTEATPPVPVYNDTVMISLSESLKLQKDQAELLKELSKKHAVEKLWQNMCVKIGDKLPVNNISEYRSNNSFFDINSDNDGEEDEENKSNDGDDEDRDTIVCFKTENDEYES